MGPKEKTIKKESEKDIKTVKEELQEFTDYLIKAIEAACNNGQIKKIIFNDKEELKQYIISKGGFTALKGSEGNQIVKLIVKLDFTYNDFKECNIFTDKGLKREEFIESAKYKLKEDLDPTWLKVGKWLVKHAKEMEKN